MKGDPAQEVPSTPDKRIQHIERLVDAIDLPIGRWDTRQRLTFCNAPYLAWADRPREDLLGNTLAQLFGDAAWNAARTAFEQAFEGRTVFYERLLTHGRGLPRWARIQVFPDADAAGRVEGVYTIAFDIHADVVAREALEAARRRFDRFAENIPYPLTYVDRGCVLQFVNKAYAAAAGLPVDRLLGRHIGDVRGPRRWEEHRPYFTRALARESGVVYTGLVELRDQVPRWMRTSYVPDLDETGAVAGVYTVTIDVHELTIARERLQLGIERDALTDVYSRRAMMDRIDAALLDTSRWPVALFFVDLDGFKAVNDTLGHRAGDELLAQVAASLQAAVRGDDSVGRFGGDEFLVLACVRSAEAARTLSDHLLAAVAATPGAQRVTASIGYAVVPDDGTNTAHLLQCADDAMYAAKRRGGAFAAGCGGPKSAGRSGGVAAQARARLTRAGEGFFLRHDVPVWKRTAQGLGLRGATLDEQHRARRVEHPSARTGDRLQRAICAHGPRAAVAQDESAHGVIIGAFRRLASHAVGSSRDCLSGPGARVRQRAPRRAAGQEFRADSPTGAPALPLPRGMPSRCHPSPRRRLAVTSK